MPTVPPSPDGVDWLTRLGAPYVAAALSGLLSALIGLLTWMAVRIVARIDAIESALQGRATQPELNAAIAALAAVDARISKELGDLRVHVEHAGVTKDDLERRLASILTDLRVVEARLYDIARAYNTQPHRGSA